MSPEKAQQRRDQEVRIQIKNLIEVAKSEFEKIEEVHGNSATRQVSANLPLIIEKAKPTSESSQTENSAVQESDAGIIPDTESVIGSVDSAIFASSASIPSISQGLAVPFGSASPSGQSQEHISQQTLVEIERKPEHKKRIEEVIGLAAAKIARDIGSDCVVSIEKIEKKESKEDDKEHARVLVSIFRKQINEEEDKAKWEKLVYETRMNRVMSGTVAPIKDLLMEAVNKKYIQKGERVVCVEDESLGMGYKGLLFIFDVDQIFFNISTMKLAENLDSEAIEAIINIALEISNEGREGRKVGTAFVVGNIAEISPYVKQMIINPFSGVPEEMRKVTDPEIKETVKEFAQLDGVFILSDKGIIHSAGTYINVDGSDVVLPGYGTRHRCSCALTKRTSAIVIVVSESGGRVTVFKDGKISMRLA